MPELPEVETVKRVLEPQIRGLTIREVLINRPEVIAHPGADAFCRQLTGQKVSGITRRGKFLKIALDSGDHIILHLRMTGSLLFTPANLPEERHTHIVFRLSSGKELRFSDTRRFGRFWLLQKEEADPYSGIDKLGLEPFDTKLTAAYLTAHFGKRRKAIKECLLEQTVLAGIGNIYSDEILFTAGIYPARPANSLRPKEWERLAAVIPERLTYFTEKNKLTPEEYLETKGQEYRNTPFLQVYGHEGKPCPSCGEILRHIVVGGRSSVYCPACQKDLLLECIRATGEHAEQVYALVQKTITVIYPRYYPAEIVKFFCKLHSEERIRRDIEKGNVSVLFLNHKLIGTGSCQEDHITRVYVDPEYQGKGYGSFLMQRLEDEIALHYDTAHLDASRPAYHLYEKRGYMTVRQGHCDVENGVFLDYEIMERNLRK